MSELSDRTKLELIGALVPPLLSVIGQAALGSEASGVARSVPKYLDILGAILTNSTQTAADLIALRDLVRDMAREDREPTNDEWDALSAQSEAAFAIIAGTDISE